jgi:Na+/proline symporter
MVFISFQFNRPPIVFNPVTVDMTAQQEQSLSLIEAEYDVVFQEKRALLQAYKPNDTIQAATVQSLQFKQDSIRQSYKASLLKIDPDFEDKDSDYIFLTFILNFLPPGLIGLLLAVIFSAAMSSTSGELNSLSATTTIDYYKKFWSKTDDDKKDLRVSKWLTVAWGIMAILIALTCGMFENLIQLVNILGSLFYGTILGIFLLALFFKRVHGTAAFIAGIVAQITVLVVHLLKTYEVIDVGYLMYNFIGCMMVILVGIVVQGFYKEKGKKELLEME